jgi:hypothetical protein
MADYSISSPSGTIRLTATGEIVPQDDTTLAFQTYWAWVLAGGTPDQLTDPPVQYPRITVTAFQMLQVLINQGLDEQVEYAVMNSGDKLLTAAYRFANVWASDCAPLQANLYQISMDEAGAYALFQAAAGMPVLADETAMQATAVL